MSERSARKPGRRESRPHLAAIESRIDHRTGMGDGHPTSDTGLTPVQPVLTSQQRAPVLAIRSRSIRA